MKKVIHTLHVLVFLSLLIFGGLGVVRVTHHQKVVRTQQKEWKLLAQDSSLLPLNSAIYRAAIEGRSLEIFRKEALSYGISILSETELYLPIRYHLQKNPLLKQAFLTAKSSGVMIYLDREFKIGKGYVLIDATATDQEIINFLLGTQQQNPQ